MVVEIKESSHSSHISHPGAPPETYFFFFFAGLSCNMFRAVWGHMQVKHLGLKKFGVHILHSLYIC